MKLRYQKTSILLGLVFLALAIASVPSLWADPPGRVGRLNLVSGTVSFHPESVDQWAPAMLNYPLTVGDQLWTDQDGQAEVHVGSTAIRLASSTELSFLNLDDQTIQIRPSTGSLDLRVRHMAPGEELEVDTPNASLSLLRAGTYRIDVQQGGDTTATVRLGEAEVTAGGEVFPLGAGQTAEIAGLDSPAYQVFGASRLDDWEQWCQARDQKEDQVASAQYVPRDEMSGVEDLDAYGAWSNDPEYGPVWTPRVIAPGWSPYSFGHWAWVDPWGWTWIDDAAWGFAPFHYGRWAFRTNAWRWVPGAHITRAVYAPALVTFVGGGDWRSSSAPGGSIGWFPLGPHEPFVPTYRTNRTLTHNIDVAHVVYTNRGVPGALIIVSNDTFVRGQRTGGAGLRMPTAEFARAPVRGAVAPIVPQRESFLGGSASSRSRVSQPPAAAMSRTVVARLTPPPPAVPFAARQRTLAAHPGQPIDAATLSQLRGSAPAVRSPVRVATPGSPRNSAAQPSMSAQRQPAENQPRRPVAAQTRTAVQPARQQPQAPVQTRTAVQPARQQPQAPVQARTAVQPARQQPQAPVQTRTAVQPARQQPQAPVQTRTAVQPAKKRPPAAGPGSDVPCLSPPCY